MFETILAIACAALVVFGAFHYLTHRTTKKDLGEYKELFGLADQAFKESQHIVQNLLETSTERDVLLERGVNALTVANDKLKEQGVLLGRLATEVNTLRSTIEFQEGQYSKLLSQKKSSEVRTGKIAEQISPFLDDYPLDPKTARFIGDPIDFVHFDEDKVTFVEVKSGKSQLSTKQRHIRDLIKLGKVEFIIYRVEGVSNGSD